MLQRVAATSAEPSARSPLQPRASNAQNPAAPSPKKPGTNAHNWIDQLQAQREPPIAQCTRMGALEEGEKPPASGDSCETHCAAPVTADASSKGCTPSVAQSITAAAINTADPVGATASKGTAVAVAASVAPVTSAVSSSSGGGGGGGSGSSECASLFRRLP